MLSWAIIKEATGSLFITDQSFGPIGRQSSPNISGLGWVGRFCELGSGVPVQAAGRVGSVYKYIRNVRAFSGFRQVK